MLLAVASVIAIIFGIALSALPVDPIAIIVTNIVILALAVLVFSKVKFDNLTIIELVLVFFAIGIVGSILQLFMPSIGEFLLTIGSFEIRTLLLTVLYLGSAEWLLQRVIK